MRASGRCPRQFRLWPRPAPHSSRLSDGKGIFQAHAEPRHGTNDSRGFCFRSTIRKPYKNHACGQTPSCLDPLAKIAIFRYQYPSSD